MSNNKFIAAKCVIRKRKTHDRLHLKLTIHQKLYLDSRTLHWLWVKFFNRSSSIGFKYFVTYTATIERALLTDYVNMRQS